jgi:hypothetical protein
MQHSLASTVTCDPNVINYALDYLEYLKTLSSMKELGGLCKGEPLGYE